MNIFLIPAAAYLLYRAVGSRLSPARCPGITRLDFLCAALVSCVALAWPLKWISILNGWLPVVTIPHRIRPVFYALSGAALLHLWEESRCNFFPWARRSRRRLSFAQQCGMSAFAAVPAQPPDHPKNKPVLSTDSIPAPPGDCYQYD